VRWWGWWRRRPKCAPRGEQAHREAEGRLREVKERWPDVREVSESLRQHQQRNGFGDAMMSLFRGGPT
jgi:hypothetical protein